MASNTRGKRARGGAPRRTHLEICQPRSVQAIVRLKSSFHWKPSTCMAFLSLLLARNPFLLSPARSAGLNLSVPPTTVSLALPLSTALSPGPEWRGGRVQGYSGAVEKYILVSSLGTPIFDDRNFRKSKFFLSFFFFDNYRSIFDNMLQRCILFFGIKV